RRDVGATTNAVLGDVRRALSPRQSIEQSEGPPARLPRELRCREDGGVVRHVIVHRAGWRPTRRWRSDAARVEELRAAEPEDLGAFDEEGPALLEARFVRREVDDSGVD